MGNAAIDIESLTTAERWSLIERLWVSLGDTPSELSPAHRAELDSRLADLDADIAAGASLGRPWQAVRSG